MRSNPVEKHAGGEQRRRLSRRAVLIWALGTAAALAGGGLVGRHWRKTDEAASDPERKAAAAEAQRQAEKERLRSMGYVN